MDVPGIRREIPALQSFIYLNSGWQGPSPRPVLEAIKETLDWESTGPTAPHINEGRMDLIRRARLALAELIHASPEEISLQQNTTEGINIVFNGLSLTPEDEIVTCSLEHSSVLVPAYYARQRRGVGLKIVQLSAADSTQDVLAKFEEAISARTRLLALSHISYNSGQLLPLAELAKLAHDCGAHLLVDAAQSVGQTPVDVRALDCDFYAFPGHKWLLGPAGTGGLYVRRDLIERLEPPKVAFRASRHYDVYGHFEPKVDTIAKFELTTVSAPLSAGLIAAVKFSRGIGLEAIAERIRSLATYAIRRLSENPKVRILSPVNGSGSGLISFAITAVEPQKVTASLWEWGRIVSRTVADVQGTRLSLHAFNTEEEIDQVRAYVQRLAEGSPLETATTAQLEEKAITEL